MSDDTADDSPDDPSYAAATSPAWSASDLILAPITLLGELAGELGQAAGTRARQQVQPEIDTFNNFAAWSILTGLAVGAVYLNKR